MLNFALLNDQKVRTEFWQYFLVVLIGLVVDIGGLYLLVTFTPAWYFLAAALSFTLAVVTNYLLASRFVFNTHTNPKRFSVFFLISLSTLALNQLGIYLFVEYFLLSVLLSKFLTLPFTFTWNFIWNKILVFKKEFNTKVL